MHILQGGGHGIIEGSPRSLGRVSAQVMPQAEKGKRATELKKGGMWELNRVLVGLADRFWGCVEQSRFRLMYSLSN